MSQQSYRTSVSVDRTPIEVFDVINDVRGWWSEEVEGATDQVGAEFTYHGHDDARTVEHVARIRVTELVPGERVVWRVLDNRFSFVADQTEWKDTEIRFDLSELDGGGTEIRFTHVGLVPAYECFDICSTAWAFYIGDSLRSAITTGAGMPISDRAEGRAPAGEPVG